jgi:hypothetical protein
MFYDHCFLLSSSCLFLNGIKFAMYCLKHVKFRPGGTDAKKKEGDRISKAEPELDINN